MAYDPRYIRFAVEHLCPGIVLIQDYELTDNGEGPFISMWNRADIPQPTKEQIEAVDTDPLIPPPPQATVLSQDLMAQFAPDDIAKIAAAIGESPALALLWYSLLAQRDPMIVTNDRFKSGWSALISVLGRDRMNAIAAALGVTVA